ncbi:ArsR/SmtB family transcription factor [Natronomonas marina]|jgi:DNA-binding transcriptional ArsR family regulator|uniref:ArsR/SmtB family transcription factor n=1 Tax=Natronomonas marina TaxID=2961939 RepID=UPI0020C93E5B|nr:winged helix-turn-helix domain-containing protein [Natronomonas marina]
MSLLPSSPDVSPDSDPRLVGLDSEEADELMAALSSETARRLLAELHDEPAPPGELADRVDTSLQNAQYHLEKLENAGAIEDVGTAYSEKGREMTVYGPADSPLVIYAGEQERASGLRAALSRLFGGVLALVVGSLAVQELFGRSLLSDLAGTGSGAGGDPNGGAGGDDGDTGFDANATEDGGTPTDEVGISVNDDAGTATPEGTPAGGNGGDGRATETPLEEETAVPTDEPRIATETEAVERQAGTPTEAPAATETAAAQDGGAGPLDFLDGLLDGLIAGGLPPGLAFFVGGFTVLSVVVVMTYLRAQP